MNLRRGLGPQQEQKTLQIGDFFCVKSKFHEKS